MWYFAFENKVFQCVRACSRESESGGCVTRGVGCAIDREGRKRVGRVCSKEREGRVCSREEGRVCSRERGRVCVAERGRGGCAEERKGGCVWVCGECSRERAKGGCVRGKGNRKKEKRCPEINVGLIGQQREKVQP